MPPTKRQRMFKLVPPRELREATKITLQAPVHIPFYLKDAQQHDCLFRYMTPVALSGASLMIWVDSMVNGVREGDGEPQVEVELTRSSGAEIESKKLSQGENLIQLGGRLEKGERLQGVLKQGQLTEVWITLTVHAYADTQG